MAVLLIILFVTIALAIRAGIWRRTLRAADPETADDHLLDDTGLIDTCARSFTLVLMSLLGLFALSVTYGNVLGAGAP